MDRDAIEKQEGFDRLAAIEAMDAFFTAKLGSPMGELNSDVPGVIAIDEISSYDWGKFSWDELAAHMVRATGVAVTCIADADWEQVDDCDTPATFIAFDLPSTPEDYKDDPYRNKLFWPIRPDAIPTDEDFANRDKAMTFARAHRKELEARLGYVKGEEAETVESQKKFLDFVVAGNINPQAHAIVQALLERDVTKAQDLLFVAAEDTAAPTPTP